MKTIRSGEEGRRLQAYRASLQSKNNTAAEAIKDVVFEHYKQFIETSKEISRNNQFVFKNETTIIIRFGAGDLPAIQLIVRTKKPNRKSNGDEWPRKALIKWHFRPERWIHGPLFHSNTSTKNGRCCGMSYSIK